MLISHVHLYPKLCLLTLIHLSFASNSSNHLLIVSPVQVDHSVNVEANHNSHHHHHHHHPHQLQLRQSNPTFDPNLFELLEDDDESINSDQSDSSLTNNNNYHPLPPVDRTAEDTSSTWSRLSSNVVRVFSPARLSSRLNQG